MKKNWLLSIALLTGINAARAQTYTLTSQPGPANGQDAEIRMMDGGCQTAGSPLPDHFMIYGNEPYMSITDWTWVAAGCSGGTLRSLIRFDEISLIPPGAVIGSATMILSHPSSSAPYWGNNYYPGTPLPNTNPGTVYLADRTAATWYENNIWWNNSPTFEPGLTAAIPVTTTQWNGSVSIDVTNLVQEIINGGGVNNGFYLKLNTEVHYRSQVYATSEYPDSDLRPKLIVEYKVPCDPSFTYCISTNNPFLVNFTANNPNSIAYEWIVNGAYAGNTSSLAYNFPGPGSYEVCLTTVAENGDKCRKCIKICLDKNSDVAGVKEKPAATPAAALQQNPAKADNPLSESAPRLFISPNPSNDRIQVKAPFGMYQVSIKSSFGLSVLDKKFEDQKTIELSVAHLLPGTYVVEVSSKEGKISREKFTKL